jgi:hypothetical protein
VSRHHRAPSNPIDGDHQATNRDPLLLSQHPTAHQRVLTAGAKDRSAWLSCRVNPERVIPEGGARPRRGGISCQNGRCYHFRYVCAPSTSVGGEVMAAGCTHLERIQDTTPSSWGCEDCLAAGRRDWVHLRVCQECGHVGCCDNSPGRHATGHFRSSTHPIIRSYEPGEDWYWCYVDDIAFELEGSPPAPSHP